eukprot:211684-Prymnesium_polylepis.1
MHPHRRENSNHNRREFGSWVQQAMQSDAGMLKARYSRRGAIRTARGCIGHGEGEGGRGGSTAPGFCPNLACSDENISSSDESSPQQRMNCSGCFWPCESKHSCAIDSSIMRSAIAPLLIPFGHAST